MKQSVKKALAGSLCALMVAASMSVPAFAETQSVAVGDLASGSASKSVEVTANVVSSFTVTIPKVVTLTKDGGGSGNYNAEFVVSAYGDIADKEVLTVAPVRTVEMTGSKATAPITAKVDNAQDDAAFKTLNEFSRTQLTGKTDVAPEARTHTVLAENMTPGDWTGTMNVAISLAVPEV